MDLRPRRRRADAGGLTQIDVRPVGWRAHAAPLRLVFDKISVTPWRRRPLAAAACSYLAKRVEVAKLYHFDSDRDGLFRRKPSPGQL